MDFSEIREKASEKFNSLLEIVRDFVNENKKLAIIIASLVGVILICLIILICTLSSGKNKKEVQIPELLNLSENQIIPKGPAIPNDYNLSRETKEKWTEEEATQWFTVPTEKEIESLSKTNDKIVKEIIGAAP